ncbi:MAG: hypothetical protein ACTHQ3_12770 [Motilibacteraceae bacterium]
MTGPGAGPIRRDWAGPLVGDVAKAAVARRRGEPLPVLVKAAVDASVAALQVQVDDLSAQVVAARARLEGAPLSLRERRERAAAEKRAADLAEAERLEAAADTSFDRDLALGYRLRADALRKGLGS